MGSLLLAAGGPGERRALPNTCVKMESLSVNDLYPTDGDMAVCARVHVIYAKHTRQSIDRIQQSMHRMSPEKASSLASSTRSSSTAPSPSSPTWPVSRREQRRRRRRA
uniref:Uncharacterized protein n=1 Tax=Ananas comosus var. bracteatus TaxID=296719 RepID=A0A6V7PYL6_ANACO|nr:unnamed protein product [Ananas comosus var. bracteatus]